MDRPAANKGMSHAQCVMVSISDIAHEDHSCTFTSYTVSVVVVVGQGLDFYLFF